MKQLAVETLGSGYAWLDTGTHDAMLEASQFVEIIERRQGTKVACLDEIVWRMNCIDTKNLRKLAQPPLIKSGYAD